MFNQLVGIPQGAHIWLVALLVWTLVWKGMAMWKAARTGAKYWFVAFLIINTVGILEILYLYVFSQPKGEHAKGA